MFRCQPLAPSARERSTYGRVFTESTWARTMRAVDGHDVMPITTMMTPSEGLSTEASTIASGRNGMTRNQSVRRIRTVSDTPPRYPATMPMNDPITIEIAVASSPTVSETREPQIVRVRTDRP